MYLSRGSWAPPPRELTSRRALQQSRLDFHVAWDGLHGTRQEHLEVSTQSIAIPRLGRADPSRELQIERRHDSDHSQPSVDDSGQLARRLEGGNSLWFAVVTHSDPRDRWMSVLPVPDRSDRHGTRRSGQQAISDRPGHDSADRAPMGRTDDDHIRRLVLGDEIQSARNRADRGSTDESVLTKDLGSVGEIAGALSVSLLLPDRGLGEVRLEILDGDDDHLAVHGVAESLCQSQRVGRLLAGVESKNDLLHGRDGRYALELAAPSAPGTPAPPQ